MSSTAYWPQNAGCNEVNCIFGLLISWSPQKRSPRTGDRGN